MDLHVVSAEADKAEQLEINSTETDSTTELQLVKDLMDELDFKGEEKDDGSVASKAKVAA